MGSSEKNAKNKLKKPVPKPKTRPQLTGVFLPVVHTAQVPAFRGDVPSESRARAGWPA